MHTVQGIGAAFIVTEILIPSVSRAVYLLWVFMYLSSGWLDEGGEKSIKTEEEMDVGRNIMAQPCIIPQFYDKYLMKTPARLMEAHI